MHSITHLPAQAVVGGVDTHLDTHTAAAVTGTGVFLGSRQFPATSAGYRQLLDWLQGFGVVDRVGVEGTGSYGAGLTRHLTARQVEVVEVDRPDRATRRRQGKSDPIDAHNAAMAVLSGRATGVPKDSLGKVEALRNLRVARNDAVNHRAQTITKLKAIIATAPNELRDQFKPLGTPDLIRQVAALRPDLAAAAAGDITAAVKTTMRSLARTYRHLSDQIAELDALITPLIRVINPTILDVHGLGPDTAGQLLVTAGSNPTRMRSEACFAMLTGAAPLPASSGRTNRHRINHGGDRQANKALWRIALTRMATDQRTKNYIAKRTQEGLTKRDIIRCLKRYIAREIFPILTLDKP